MGVAFALTALASSYNFAPPTAVSRRAALGRLPFVGAAALVAFAPSTQAAEEEKPQDAGTNQQQKPETTAPPAHETEAEKKARIMREKIAASKTNYRKPEKEDRSPFRLLGK